MRKNVSEDKNTVVWICLINDSRIISQALAMKIVNNLGGPMT
jgi:hypothetical protein